jgi:hypothetical protein
MRMLPLSSLVAMNCLGSMPLTSATCSKLSPTAATTTQHEQLNEVVDRIDTVIARIRKTPAKTLEGFAVKVLALQFGAPDLWREDPHDMDWDQFLIAELANEILGHLPFEGTRYASA